MRWGLLSCPDARAGPGRPGRGQYGTIEDNTDLYLRPCRKYNIHDNASDDARRIKVFGRDFLLYDCDDFTKNHYRTKYGVSQFPDLTDRIETPAVEVRARRRRRRRRRRRWLYPPPFPCRAPRSSARSSSGLSCAVRLRGAGGSCRCRLRGEICGFNRPLFARGPAGAAAGGPSAHGLRLRGGLAAEHLPPHPQGLRPQCGAHRRVKDKMSGYEAASVF